MLMETSFACCGMLANHPGEFGCPTKRPSSECMTSPGTRCYFYLSVSSLSPSLYTYIHICIMI